MSRRLTRTLAGAAALAVGSASILLVASPAVAATLHVPAASIAPSEASTDVDGVAYQGWHAQVGAGGYADAWNGIRIGGGADTYLLNGLVPAGTAGTPITPAALSDLITSSLLTGTGTVLTEVPFSIDTTPENPPFADSWGTLRSVDSTLGATPTLDDLWVSSRTLGGTNPPVVANVPMTLGDIITAFASRPDVAGMRYSGFGFYAVQQSPSAVVSSMTWGADTHTFGRIVSPVAPSSEVVVGASEIAPNEDEYTGWHEGYANATPAYSVQSNGLHLGDGANSQIINGLETPITTDDPFSLLASAGVNVVSGEAFYQVPVFYSAANIFTTLRPAVGDGPGTSGVALSDLWVSSNAIAAEGAYAGVAANTPVPLGDILELLVAYGDVDVLAFGVLAQETTPTVVAEIIWNGVTYSFVPLLAATGADTSLALGAASALLLAGGALLILRRRSVLGAR